MRRTAFFFFDFPAIDPKVVPRNDLKLCSLLSHPNLMKLYGITPPPDINIVMEFMPYGTQLSLQFFSLFLSLYVLFFVFFLIVCSSIDLILKFVAGDLFSLIKKNVGALQSWTLRFRIVLDIAKGMRYALQHLFLEIQSIPAGRS